MDATVMVVGDFPRADCRTFPADPTRWGPAYEFAHLILDKLGLLQRTHWTWLSWCAPAPGIELSPADLRRAMPTFLDEFEVVNPQVLIVVEAAANSAILDTYLRPRDVWQRRRDLLDGLEYCFLDPDDDLKESILTSGQPADDVIKDWLRDPSDLGRHAQPAPLSSQDFGDELLGIYYEDYRGCPRPTHAGPLHWSTRSLTASTLSDFGDLFLGDGGFRTQPPATPWTWSTSTQSHQGRDERIWAVWRHLLGMQTLASFFHPRTRPGGYCIAYDVDVHDEFQRSVADETVKALKNLVPEAYWVTSPRGFHAYLFADPDGGGHPLEEMARVLEIPLLEKGLVHRRFGDLQVRLVEVLPRPGAGLRLPLGPRSWPVFRKGLDRSSPKEAMLRDLLHHALGPGAGSYERFREETVGWRRITAKRAHSNAERHERVLLFATQEDQPPHPWDEFFNTFLPGTLALAWQRGIPAFGMRQQVTVRMQGSLFGLGFNQETTANIIRTWLGRPGHVSRDLRVDPDGTAEEVVEQVSEFPEATRKTYPPAWSVSLRDPDMLLAMACFPCDVEALRARVGDDARILMAGMRLVCYFRAHQLPVQGNPTLHIAVGVWKRLTGDSPSAVKKTLLGSGVVTEVVAGRRKGIGGAEPLPARYPRIGGAPQLFQLGLQNPPLDEEPAPWDQALQIAGFAGTRHT